MGLGQRLSQNDVYTSNDIHRCHVDNPGRAKNRVTMYKSAQYFRFKARDSHANDCNSAVHQQGTPTDYSH